MMKVGEIKKCSKCKQFLSLDNFNKDKRSKDGLNCCCKECHLAYRQAHREEAAIYNRVYNQTRRKDMTAYNKAYRQSHREVMAARSRIYWQSHIEEITAWYRVYRRSPRGKAVQKNANHKRRSLTKDGTASSKQISELLKTAKKCYWCGCKLTKKTGIHIDHYDPLLNGGKHTIDNLVVACVHCNLTKHTKDPIDFAHSVGRLL